MKTLSDKFNSIAVKKGEMFAVELNGNPSTGYVWETHVASGKAHVVKKDTIPHSSNPMVIGGGATERTIYQADETGTIEIQAYHRRPWEKNTPPAQTKVFKIDVT